MNSKLKMPFADPVIGEEEMKYVTESVELW